MEKKLGGVEGGLTDCWIVEWFFGLYVSCGSARLDKGSVIFGGVSTFWVVGWGHCVCDLWSLYN